MKISNLISLFSSRSLKATLILVMMKYHYYPDNTHTTTGATRPVHAEVRIFIKEDHVYILN